MTEIFLNKDLVDVKKELIKQYNCQIPTNIEKEFNLLHKKIFCFSDLIYHIIKSESLRMDFLEELRSDLVHLLTFSSLGFKKPIALSIRSCIEDTIRHIYYHDHPVELELLNETGETQITVTETFQYLNLHPLFKKYKKYSIIYNFLINEYGSTSRLVHGSSVKYFQLSKSISELRLNESEFKNMNKYFVKLLDCLISSMIIFHKEEFIKIHPDHKNLILKNLSPFYKKIIHCI